MPLPSEKEKIVGIFEAFSAAVIWGFAFITLRWAVDSYGPLWSRALSFVAVAIVLLPIGLIVTRWRKHYNTTQLGLAFFPGLALGLGLCFQSLGIRQTSVANSGFITVLYIVLIPIGERLIFSQRLHRTHWLAVALALLGSALLCGGLPSQWNTGDVLTLGCAVFGAGHFLALQRVAARVTNAFFFNGLQVAWAAAVTVPVAWLMEPFPSTIHNSRALWSLAFLSYGSIMCGFMLQVRAQRMLSSTVAGLVCLLEGPIAAIFAYFILSENMTPFQIVGALIVLAAAGLAGLAPAPATIGKSK